MGARERLRELYLELEGLLVLLKAGKEKDFKFLDEQQSKISGAKSKNVKSEIERVKGIIVTHKKQFGVEIGAPSLRALAQQTRTDSLYIPKFVVESWVKRYDLIIKEWPKFPSHIQIEFTREELRMRNSYLIEALLYKDMALLYNKAIQQREGVDESTSIKAELLYESTLYRSAIIAAFNFVEAYLNGLAADYFYSKKGKVSDADAEKLFEIKIEGKTQSFLSLRRKILEYPKIILGLKHPPIQESNCKEMEVFLDKCRLLRDSIVHPSSLPDPKSFIPKKETAFWSLDKDQCCVVIDTAINLVRRIEKEIHGSDERLFWMQSRCKQTGLFDKTVFD